LRSITKSGLQPHRVTPSRTAAALRLIAARPPFLEPATSSFVNMSSMRRLANISTHLNGPVTTNTVASEEEYKAALIECRAALAAFMDKMNANPIFVRLAWHDSGTYDKEVRVFAYCPKRVPLPHTRRLPSACAPKCHTPLSPPDKSRCRCAPAPPSLTCLRPLPRVRA